MAVFVVGLTAIPALAATCTYDGLLDTVTVTIGNGESGALRVSAGAIQFSDNGAAFANCDTATTTNTDLIDVDGGAGAQTFIVDLSGGPFAPGTTDEGDGSSEIEFTVDLGAGTDELIITGSGSADFITFGDTGTGEINLNANEATGVDDDVTLANVETFTVNAGAGNDVISAAGGAGTVAPSTLR